MKMKKKRKQTGIASTKELLKLLTGQNMIKQRNSHSDNKEKGEDTKGNMSIEHKIVSTISQKHANLERKHEKQSMEKNDRKKNPSMSRKRKHPGPAEKTSTNHSETLSQTSLTVPDATHLESDSIKHVKKTQSASDLSHKISPLSLKSSEKETKPISNKKAKKRRKRKTENSDEVSKEKHRKTAGPDSVDQDKHKHKAIDESETLSETLKKEKTPLTDRQKHKRWKLKQKRKLKCKANDNKTEQVKSSKDSVTTSVKSLPTANNNKTEQVKSSKESGTTDSLKSSDKELTHEKIVLPKGPEDASANWKKLQSILEAKKSDTEGKKKPKPHPIRRKPKKEKVLRKLKEDNAESQSSKSTENKAPEIWFDDVDEIYLAPSMRSAKPLAPAEQGNSSEVAENSKGKDKAQNPLVKPDAYKGLTKVVSMDCEMVGVGDGNENMLARVSIVNQFGEMVYDKFVKPMEKVVDFRTHVSGVRREDIEQGEEFSQVQKDVAAILKGRLLVGHALGNDLKVLFLSHPMKRIRDTSRYKPFRQLFQGRTPSLKKLTAQILNVKVQEGEHNSVQDAQAAMRLYTRYRKQWESDIKKKRKKLPEKKKGPKNFLVDKTWNKSVSNQSKNKMIWNQKK